MPACVPSAVHMESTNGSNSALSKALPCTSYHASVSCSTAIRRMRCCTDLYGMKTRPKTGGCKTAILEFRKGVKSDDKAHQNNEPPKDRRFFYKKKRSGTKINQLPFCTKAIVVQPSQPNLLEQPLLPTDVVVEPSACRVVRDAGVFLVSRV